MPSNNYTVVLQARLNTTLVDQQIQALQNRVINLRTTMAGGGGGGIPGGGGATSVAASVAGMTNAQYNAMHVEALRTNGIRDMTSALTQFQTNTAKNNEVLMKTSDITGQTIRATNKYTDASGNLITRTATLNEATGKFALTTQKVSGGLAGANQATRSWTDQISNNVQKVLQWAVATALIYGTLKKIQEGIQYITELNKSLTNISIVTGMTRDETTALGQTYNKLAVQMGVTTKAVADGSLEWFRQGKTIEQTTELMKSSLMMATLGNMTAADATEKLTATLNGFQMQAEESVSVVDRLTALDNAYATSVNEIATAMQYSAAVSKQAGVTFDQLASYIN